MDPNENLREQLRIAEWLLGLTGNLPSASHSYDYMVKAERLAELVEALDEWISKGGALPTKWYQGQAVNGGRR